MSGGESGAPDVRRVVVLGHSGFIGTYVTAELRRRPGPPCIEAPRLDLALCEQAKTLARILAPDDAVVVCSGVKRQLGDTLATFAQNVAIVANVCRVLEQHPVRRLLYLSSTAVYGEETTNLQIDEETPVGPTSTYGIAKFTCERLLRRTIRGQEGGSLVVVRPPLVYGPGDLGFYGPSGFLHGALRERRIVLWGDGSERREFLFVEDLAGLLAGLVVHPYDGVLNAVSGVGATFRQAAEVASALVPGAEIETEPRSRPKADHGFSGRLLRRLFPDLELTPLEQGMRRTLVALESGSSSS